MDFRLFEFQPDYITRFISRHTQLGMDFGSLYPLAYAYLYHVVQIKLKSILGIVSNSNKLQTVFLLAV